MYLEPDSRKKAEFGLGCTSTTEEPPQRRTQEGNGGRKRIYLGAALIAAGIGCLAVVASQIDDDASPASAPHVETNKSVDVSENHTGEQTSQRSDTISALNMMQAAAILPQQDEKSAANVDPLASVTAPIVKDDPPSPPFVDAAPVEEGHATATAVTGPVETPVRIEETTDVFPTVERVWTKVSGRYLLATALGYDEKSDSVLLRSADGRVLSSVTISELSPADVEFLKGLQVGQ